MPRDNVPMIEAGSSRTPAKDQKPPPSPKTMRSAYAHVSIVCLCRGRTNAEGSIADDEKPHK